MTQDQLFMQLTSIKQDAHILSNYFKSDFSRLITGNNISKQEIIEQVPEIENHFDMMILKLQMLKKRAAEVVADAIK